MIIDRVFTPGLAQVAYLVADERTGDVSVIDPRRDVQVYLDWANERNLRISAILETHVHADFVSGALELHNATGAPIYSSQLGDQEFDHRRLQDGNRVSVGELILEARWTPGHTPEHIVFLLFDPASSESPQAMFSGDLIFAGEVGRPDLLGATHTERLARQLFQTLTHRIADLPDDLVIYPGHTAGSACGRKIGDAAATTLGAERQFTYAYQFDNEADFVQGIMDEMPAPPPYYPRMKLVNRVGPDPIASLPAGEAMTVDEVSAAVAAGALIVDARDERSFDRAHIRGSFYAGSGVDFVAWVGWRAPYDQPIVLLLDRDEDYQAFQTELHRIGIDAVAGYLDGGIDAWLDRGQPVDRLQALSPEQFQSMLQASDDVVLLDVRSRDEWKLGHIERARNEFAGDISAGAEVETGDAEIVMLTCATGYRSRVAASMLESRGVASLVQLDGGMDAWDAAGLPVAYDR
ncbi:MAG: MBL fold metallo-hydrolase [Thermomicrobiales bacterium]|nr:MBL fold metallo-hydrolase [Thermomicrobiales bacterium]